MGKLTYLGSAPKDHPIYSGGVEIFSRPESNESLKTSAQNTTGETQDKSASVETKAEREGRLETEAFQKHRAAQRRPKAPNKT